MGGTSAYLTAVVAGAMTAGVAAAGIVAVPPDVAVSAQAKDVDLAASITIPIFDFDTPGPISISRLLTLTLNALPNNLSAILNSEAGTIYDLPGLYTNFSSAGQQTFAATRVPGDSISFGFKSLGPESGEWDVLNGFATGDTDVERGRGVRLDLLTGGSQGIGAGLIGVLSKASVDRELTLLNSGLATDFTRSILDGSGKAAVTPFSGSVLKAGGNLIASTGGANFNVGSFETGGNWKGNLGGAGGVCLGSNQVTDCAGNLSFAEVSAPVSGGLTVNGANIISADFSNNKVLTELGKGRLSITGAIGGTVKVGSLSIGQPIPIDIQIPRASSMMSSMSSARQQSVRDSFVAIPRKSASDNETGGRHRAPIRDAIENVKNAVNNAVSGKHAKPDTDD